MLPHPLPSAEGTPFGSALWVELMASLEKDAAGDKPVSYQYFVYANM
jgi:hypothetical protein